MRDIRHLTRHAGGGITALAAASLAAGLGCPAFAVDLGSIYFETRRLQGIADAAAIAAAADLPRADLAARAAVDANPMANPIDRHVETGIYRPDPAIAPADRFSPSATDINAAR